SGAKARVLNACHCFKTFLASRGRALIQLFAHPIILALIWPSATQSGTFSPK
ncbi:MAG: hypothetical protein ACJA0J_002692, partial [Bdellovibrionota bacterium]